MQESGERRQDKGADSGVDSVWGSLESMKISGNVSKPKDSGVHGMCSVLFCFFSSSFSFFFVGGDNQIFHSNVTPILLAYFNPWLYNGSKYKIMVIK